MTQQQLVSLLGSLRNLPNETEWVEFKHNNQDPDMIGECIAALSNASALLEKEFAYFVWGIDDQTHSVLGTTFRPHHTKYGNEELESWLSRHLAPCPDFRFYEFSVDGKSIVLLVIPMASHTPIRWKEIARIRIGSYTKKLYDYPEKERSLWRQFEKMPFERRIALENITADDVLRLLDYDSYFRLTQQTLSETKRGILERLAKDKLLVSLPDEIFHITNFGAILFARKLSEFENLGRKAVRVIDYAGNDRISGGQEYIADAGYAAIFENLIAYIKSRPPNNEYIGQALRVETEMYPMIAIRELVPNAMIHQDFEVRGDSPFVEIFRDRIEITNPGQPLIDPLRFIDEPPQSRNEAIAAFMRRINICEERGSGIDKVIRAVELFQLPPLNISATERHTRVSLYAHRPFSTMTSKERVIACYQHTCLMYVVNEPATNASLRKRFALDDDDYKIVTKIIASAVREGLIKSYDPDNRSPRYSRYLPFLLKLGL